MVPTNLQEYKSWNWKVEACLSILATVLATQFGPYAAQKAICGASEKKVKDIDVESQLVLDYIRKVCGEENDDENDDEKQQRQEHLTKYRALQTYTNQVIGIFSGGLLCLLMSLILLLRSRYGHKDHEALFVWSQIVFGGSLFILGFMVLSNQLFSPKTLSRYWKRDGFPPLTIVTVVRYSLILMYMLLAHLSLNPTYNTVPAKVANGSKPASPKPTTPTPNDKVKRLSGKH